VRILRLADDASAGRLVGPLEKKMSPLAGRSTGEYLNRTVYLQLAPLANFKLIRKRLISVNRLQYSMAKVLDDTFTMASSVARIPGVDYDPDMEKLEHSRQEHKHRYYRQGINRGTLDHILSGLIERDSVIDYSDFYSKFGSIHSRLDP
jgi:hypothetical protein